MNGHARDASPFPWAWWAFDLGSARGCDGTYCYYPYESIPPLPPVDESLDWLEPLDARTDAQMAIHRNPPEAHGAVVTIAESAARLGLTLPESFVRLMSNSGLQDRIPSCTACFFKLSDDILPFPGIDGSESGDGNDGGYVVRFYNDQQDVLLWYLYLTPQGAQNVLVTPIELEDYAGKTLSDDERQGIAHNTWVCAPTFAEFIYRWWLENSIWFKVSESDKADTLTADERHYLAHYRASTGNGAIH